MLPDSDYPVADDFAEIAKRLKEIEREAIEIAASERQRQLNNERRPGSPNVYDDMSACA